MTDIINLNSIRSDNCDCNKPKPASKSCGCHNHNTQPCHQAVNLGDQYFKVKNLFSELKSEWQRTEARSNLGIVDIIGLEQTKESYESGGTNEWTMTTSKGGIRSEYKFYVKNGQTGEKGEKGDKGDQGIPGKSAFEIADERLYYFTHNHYENVDDWLNSLKGKSGSDLESITLVRVETETKRLPDGTDYVGPILIWEFKIKDNPNTFQMWVPLGGGNGVVPSTAQCILYKKVYCSTPTESYLEDIRQQLLLEVNRNQSGKSKEELQSLGWDTYISHVNEGDYVFMATSTRTDDEYSTWAITRLTAIPGASSGIKGDFKSIVFTRTNIDISNAKPIGGSYDNPIPTSTTLGPNTLEITWSDGVPDGLAQLWATTCTFRGDGTTSDWDFPKRMTDTSTYDVEFCIKEDYQGNPDQYPGNWFDPDTRLYGNGTIFSGSFEQVIWRAEREIHNGQPGNWYILRVKGEKGDPGTGGTSGQGLVGATIRLRGEWEERPEPCYVNSSDQQPDENGFRFIDIVSYRGQYWMLKAEADNTDPRCNKGIPGDETDSYQSWIPASETDFAYINTLIADYLSVYTIDTNEVRIHSTGIKNGVSHDNIVAGMTSGKNITENENNTSDNESDPIRIWAGTNIDTLQTNSYTLNLESAKFKVRQSGKLEASNADIEGIVQANTLRLGKLNDNNDGNGTYIQPNNTNTVTLPELVANKTQMFYLLTNQLSSDASFTVQVYNIENPTDSINTYGNRTFTAEGQKLYQLFGINQVWYVVEQDVAPAYVVIDPDTLTYGQDYTIDNPHFVLNFGYNNDNEVAIEAEFLALVKNMTNNNILVVFPAMSVTLNVSIQVKIDDNPYETKTGTLTVRTSDILIGVDPKGNQQFSSTQGYIHVAQDNTLISGRQFGTLEWNWEGTPPTFTDIPDTLTSQNYIGSILNRFLFNPFTQVDSGFNGQDPSVNVQFSPSWAIGKKNQINLLNISYNSPGETSLISDFYTACQEQQNND